MYWGIDLTYEINKSTDYHTDQRKYLRFLVPRNDRIAGNKLNVVISTKGDIWRFLVPRNDRNVVNELNVVIPTKGGI